MTVEPESILHLLSLRGGSRRPLQARVTVRTGEVRRGQRYWFRTQDGARREVVVKDVGAMGRHIGLQIEGDVERLEPGMFLYGVPETQ